MGADAWLDEQLAQPRGTSHVDWMRGKGYDTEALENNRVALDFSVWRKFISSPDVLRQRMVYALSQILVVSQDGLAGSFPSFSAGHYLDILEANAFGSYRTLLEQVTLSPAMGQFLSMRGSQKANATGRRPDENYAREVLQLFSIGLVDLEEDGSPKLVAGAPKASYTEADVSGLARAFTGWDYGAPVGTPRTSLRQTVPMSVQAARHETGEKTFLGTTVPANTGGADTMRLALDAIAAHPNVGPFLGKQLIQRLVTSNPSKAYVARVARAFNGNGTTTRGNLAVTLRAVLSDVEARDPSQAPDATARGKLREPVLRFVQWAIAAQVGSPSGDWKLPNLSDPARRLGQSPLHSPSVFNFYRPGYIPPGTPIASKAGVVAPEFQITTESSVAGYLNFMQSSISATVGILGSDVVPNYEAWLPLATDPAALVAQTHLLFAAGALSPATVTIITNAVASMSAGTDAQRRNRVHAAMLLTMAAPEYLVQQ